MSSERITFETILKWTVAVILAIVALKVVFAVLGVAFMVGGFLLWRVLPLVLFVWLILKLVQWMSGSGRGTGTSDPVI